jgi:hypothetical protein
VDGGERAPQQAQHFRGPWFALDLDQRLEFPQMMRVAKAVREAGQFEIGLEVVVHDHPADQALGHIAALGADAILGQRQRRGGVQPLRAAADPEPGFIKMPNRSFGEGRTVWVRRPNPQQLRALSFQGSVPWIDHRNAGGDERGDIPRRDREAMGGGDGGNLPVCDGDGMTGAARPRDQYSE